MLSLVQLQGRRSAASFACRYFSTGTPNDSSQLLSLIETRHCTHAFETSRPVPRQMIADMLKAARNAPSTNNTQPWTTIVCQGDARDKLAEAMLVKFDSGDDGKAQYQNRPSDINQRMKDAHGRYGAEFYTGHFGLARDDKDGRRQAYRPNYYFWGAPVHLILCAPSNAVAGTYLDMGSFMTAALLSAHALGLGAKPQFSVAKYHDVCRNVLGDSVLGPDLQVICGMSIGWPVDGRDPRVQPDFYPTRLEVDETTVWVVDEDF